MWGLTLLPVDFVPDLLGLHHGFLRRIGLSQNVAGRGLEVKVLMAKMPESVFKNVGARLCFYQPQRF